MTASFKVEVIHADEMKGTSAKSGKAYSLAKLHCLIDLGGDAGRRVCQLVHNEMIPRGAYLMTLLPQERDGRTVFLPSSFVPVGAGK